MALSGFVIPKKKKVKQELPPPDAVDECANDFEATFEDLLNGSNAYKDLQQTICDSCSDRMLRRALKVGQISLIHNPGLTAKFNGLKKKLRAQQHPVDTTYTFRFIEYKNHEDVTALERMIADNGLAVGTDAYGDLGCGSMGVHVVRSVDLVMPLFCCGSKISVVMFKTLRGRPYEVDINSPQLEPSVNHFSHEVKRNRAISDRLLSYRLDQIYCYEVTESGVPVDIPSSLLPYAIFTLEMPDRIHSRSQLGQVIMSPRLSEVCVFDIPRESNVFGGQRCHFRALRADAQKPTSLNHVPFCNLKVCKMQDICKDPRFSVLLRQTPLNSDKSSGLFTERERVYSLSPQSQYDVRDGVGQEEYLYAAHFIIQLDENGQSFLRIIEFLRDNQLILASWFTFGNQWVYVFPACDIAMKLGLPYLEKPHLNCIVLSESNPLYNEVPAVLVNRCKEKSLSSGSQQTSEYSIYANKHDPTFIENSKELRRSLPRDGLCVMPFGVAIGQFHRTRCVDYRMENRAWKASSRSRLAPIPRIQFSPVANVESAPETATLNPGYQPPNYTRDRIEETAGSRNRASPGSTSPNFNDPAVGLLKKNPTKPCIYQFPRKRAVKVNWADSCGKPLEAYSDGRIYEHHESSSLLYKKDKEIEKRAAISGVDAEVDTDNNEKSRRLVMKLATPRQHTEQTDRNDLLFKNAFSDLDKTTKSVQGLAEFRDPDADIEKAPPLPPSRLKGSILSLPLPPTSYAGQNEYSPSSAAYASGVDDDAMDIDPASDGDDEIAILEPEPAPTHSSSKVVEVEDVDYDKEMQSSIQAIAARNQVALPEFNPYLTPLVNKNDPDYIKNKEADEKQRKQQLHEDARRCISLQLEEEEVEDDENDDDNDVVSMLNRINAKVGKKSNPVHNDSKADQAKPVTEETTNYKPILDPKLTRLLEMVRKSATSVNATGSNSAPVRVEDTDMRRDAAPSFSSLDSAKPSKDVDHRRPLRTPTPPAPKVAFSLKSKPPDTIPLQTKTTGFERVSDEEEEELEEPSTSKRRTAADTDYRRAPKVTSAKSNSDRMHQSSSFSINVEGIPLPEESAFKERRNSAVNKLLNLHRHNPASSQAEATSFAPSQSLLEQMRLAMIKPADNAHEDSSRSNTPQNNRSDSSHGSRSTGPSSPDAEMSGPSSPIEAPMSPDAPMSPVSIDACLGQPKIIPVNESDEEGEIRDDEEEHTRSSCINSDIEIIAVKKIGTPKGQDRSHPIQAHSSPSNSKPIPLMSINVPKAEAVPISIPRPSDPAPPAPVLPSRPISFFNPLPTTGSPHAVRTVNPRAGQRNLTPTRPGPGPGVVKPPGPNFNAGIGAMGLGLNAFAAQKKLPRSICIVPDKLTFHPQNCKASSLQTLLEKMVDMKNRNLPGHEQSKVTLLVHQSYLEFINKEANNDSNPGAQQEFRLYKSLIETYTAKHVVRSMQVHQCDNTVQSTKVTVECMTHIVTWMKAEVPNTEMYYMSNVNPESDLGKGIRNAGAKVMKANDMITKFPFQL